MDGEIAPYIIHFLHGRKNLSSIHPFHLLFKKRKKERNRDNFEKSKNEIIILENLIESF